jgi:hypothetical protein
MMEDRPDKVETLRLVTAFFNIADPEFRRVILAIVEAKAGGAPLTAESLRPMTDEAKQR